MTRKELASTALFVAAVRARETDRKDGLFKDELSLLLAGREGVARLAASEADPMSNYHRDSFPYLEVRTRYFDDWLTAVVKKTGALQVVFLGAGMDTRAFRLSWPEGVKLWELDTRELFSVKESRLHAAKAQPNCDRQAVTGDLLSTEWPKLLVEAGLKKNRPTVWLAEGLFQYLTEDQVGQILDNVASLSAPGSSFGAEIIAKEYIARVSNRVPMARRRARGTAWTFGTDDPDGLLHIHGWRVDERERALEAAVSYGRWKKISLEGTPAAWFVTATKR